MKSKMKILVIIGVVFLLAIAIIVCYFMMSAQEIDIPLNDRNAVVESELIANVSSEEEAQEIADLYEIDLKNYSAGIAVYSTTKPADEVIRYGQENGYPQLDHNFTHYAY